MTPTTATTVRPGWTASSSQSVSVDPDATGGTTDASGAYPLSIPLGHEYYWSFEWQQSVRRHHEERAAGDVVEFDNADDLIFWLFEGEDE